MKKLTRRQLLKTTGAAVSVTILGQPLFHVGRASDGPSFVRRDIAGLTADDPIITSYKAAISMMKTLDLSDARSWAYQAAIHGRPFRLGEPTLTAWRTCEHDTDFFWSWHRIYLYFFERIIRRMSGDPDWALPYWNWTSESERTLPLLFRVPANEKENALYTPHRDLATPRYSSITSTKRSRPR